MVVLHNPTNSVQDLNLSEYPSLTLCECVGDGSATLNSGVVSLDALTSAILRIQ